MSTTNTKPRYDQKVTTRKNKLLDALLHGECGQITSCESGHNRKDLIDVCKQSQFVLNLHAHGTLESPRLCYTIRCGAIPVVVGSSTGSIRNEQFRLYIILHGMKRFGNVNGCWKHKSFSTNVGNG